MNNGKIERITRGGLLVALICILTAFVRLPLPVGYAHLGDGAVILSGVTLGLPGVLCAAVGTALADLVSGFPIYIPFSIVIKGLMAYLAGKTVRGREKVSRHNLVSLALILLLVPALYFFADWLYYGLPAAEAALLGNLGQAAVGYVMSLLLLGGGLMCK